MEPLAYDRNGVPIYPGTKVQFVVEHRAAVVGEILTAASESSDGSEYAPDGFPCFMGGSLHNTGHTCNGEPAWTFVDGQTIKYVEVIEPTN